MISVNACSTLGGSSNLQQVQYPELDGRDLSCAKDPGVNKDSWKALAENRAAYLDCKLRHKNVTLAYNDLIGQLNRLAQKNQSRLQEDPDR